MSRLIEVEQVTYAHEQQDPRVEPALRGISLHIDEGEMVAVVGANGSGKTTLARHLNGLLQPTSGRVRVAGLDTSLPGNRQRVFSTVGMVFQFPEDQLVASVVEEDVAFGPENLSLPPEEVRQRVETALRAVGMWDWRKRPPHMLSAGQMQRVALAGILAMRPRCIVFDEATAMLDPAGRRTVMDLLHQLHQEGMTVVFITHFMEEAVQAERVIILDQGKLALDGTPMEVFADEGRLRGLGLDLPPVQLAAKRLHEVFPQVSQDVVSVDELIASLPGGPATAGTVRRKSHSGVHRDGVPMIEVSGLSHTYLPGTPFAHQALNDVDLQVEKGGSLGLIGGTGSGKSTLMQHLNCLFKPFTGRVRVGPLDFNSPGVSVYQACQIVGLVFQNPEAQFFEEFVGDEIAYGPRLQGPERNELRQRVKWAMGIVGLDFDAFKDRLTYTLSGGEKRKVALAAILALKPEVLLLDEPTAGLDPQARNELIGHLRSLRNEGMTFVVSSHHMEDVVQLTDRIMVLAEGKTILEGEPGEVYSQIETLHEVGMTPPVAALIAAGLRKKGWPLPIEVVDLSGLINALKAVVQVRDE